MSADSGGGFVGEMQNLVVNGNQVFEMLRSGEFKGRSQVRGGGTATLIGPSRLTPPSPLTFRSSDAYVVVNMKIHSTFSIYIQVFLSSFMIIYRVYCFCQGHLPPKSIHLLSFLSIPPSLTLNFPFLRAPSHSYSLGHGGMIWAPNGIWGGTPCSQKWIYMTFLWSNNFVRIFSSKFRVNMHLLFLPLVVFLRFDHRAPECRCCSNQQTLYW